MGKRKQHCPVLDVEILAYVNAVNYMTGNFIQLLKLAEWSLAHGYRINGQGTAEGLYKALRMRVAWLWIQIFWKHSGNKSNIRDVRSHLQNGGIAIIDVPNHLMALVAYNGSNGKYLVLDSYTSKSCGTEAGYR